MKEKQLLCLILTWAGGTVLLAARACPAKVICGYPACNSFYFLVLKFSAAFSLSFLLYFALFLSLIILPLLPYLCLSPFLSLTFCITNKLSHSVSLSRRRTHSVYTYIYIFFLLLTLFLFFCFPTLPVYFPLSISSGPCQN